MTDIHPHWQATDEGTPIPVRVKAATKEAGKRVPIAAPAVSRQPAALLGILLVIGIGAASYGIMNQDTELLRGIVVPETSSNSDATGLKQEEDETSPSHAMQETAKGPDAETRIVADAMPSKRLSPTIPTNPHASAYPEQTVPVNTHAVSADVTERIHAGAPQPYRQPQTGMGSIVMTLGGALILMILMMRKSLQV